VTLQDLILLLFTQIGLKYLVMRAMSIMVGASLANKKAGRNYGTFK